MTFKPNKLTPGSNLMWESSRMMLPEHKEKIRQHQHEQKLNTKPVLDEQRLEEFAGLVTRAWKNESALSLTLYDPAGTYTITGHIRTIDPQEKKLLFTTEQGTEWLSFHDIVDII